MDPRIRTSTFPDLDDQFRPRLIELINEDVSTMRDDPDKYAMTSLKLETEGGWKVRSSKVWESEEARYLLEVVCQFVCQFYNQDQVHIRDRWGNFMEAGKGWYASPHSHSNADVAVVYTLACGDIPKDSIKGRLHLIDSRIPDCCLVPNYAARSLTPILTTKDAIGFPRLCDTLGKSLQWFRRPHHPRIQRRHRPRSRRGADTGFRKTRSTTDNPSQG